MELASDDFRDGDYLGHVHCLSTRYGFGCNGDNNAMGQYDLFERSHKEGTSTHSDGLGS